DHVRHQHIALRGCLQHDDVHRGDRASHADGRRRPPGSGIRRRHRPARRPRAGMARRPPAGRGRAAARLMASTPENIREHLRALPIERESAPARSRRWVRWLIVAAVLLAAGVLAARRIAAGRVPTVEAAPVTVTAGGSADGMPVLSGAGYVVSADRYISIGVRLRGPIHPYPVPEGDHVKQGDSLVQIPDPRYPPPVAPARPHPN